MEPLRCTGIYFDYYHMLVSLGPVHGKVFGALPVTAGGDFSLPVTYITSVVDKQCIKHKLMMAHRTNCCVGY